MQGKCTCHIHAVGLLPDFLSLLQNILNMFLILFDENIYTVHIQQLKVFPIEMLLIFGFIFNTLL